VDEDTIHNTHSRNPLAMFAPQPVGVSFEIQEKGEKIILLLRSHLITLIPSVLLIVILVLVPVLVSPFLGLLGQDFSLDLSPLQLLLATICWYLFVFGFSVLKFLLWYFNVYILTNERIVDFDFNGVLDKATSYAFLKQIEDVDPKIRGFFPTIFHYGDIMVQTAAERPEFEFKKVARPDDVAREILEQARLEEKEEPGVVA